MINLRKEIHQHYISGTDKYFVIGSIDGVPKFTLECVSDEQQDDLYRELLRWSKLLVKNNKTSEGV